MSRPRAPLAGAGLGALLGVLVASAELLRLTATVRGLGLRGDVLALGLLLYGGVGGLLGLLLAVVWTWIVRCRSRQPAAPRALTAALPARHERCVSRRAALRMGVGAVSLCALGALVRTGVDRTDRTSRPAAPPSPAPAPSDPPRALTGGQLTAVPDSVAPPPVATPPGASGSPAPAPATPRHQGPPNVLLITLDTVRADQLGAYGHPLVKTPSIDRLAAEGARFDAHVVQQPQTNPSHAAMFTGMYPASSGVRTHMVDTVSDRLATLATAFVAAGYATAGLYSWMSLDPQYLGLQRGFQTYRNVAPGTPAALADPAAQQAAADYRAAEQYLTLPKLVSQAAGVQSRLEETAKGRADLTTDAALAQLRQLGDGPFFLWVHYFDPHYPYQPPAELVDQYSPGYRGPVDSTMATVDAIENGKLLPQGKDLARLLALYRAELAFMDAHIGRLLAAIDQLSLRENTVVALTADHGEAFGEHLQEIVGVDFFHPHSLFNSEQRTPLILRYPPRVRSGTVVGAPTQAIDLFPTLLELAGQPVPPQNQGRSLGGLLDGSDDGAGRVAFSAMGDYTFTAVTVPGWKYIQNNASGRRQLYDLGADPAEQHDLSADKPDLAAQLAARTQAWMKAVGI